MQFKYLIDSDNQSKVFILIHVLNKVDISKN